MNLVPCLDFDKIECGSWDGASMNNFPLIRPFMHATLCVSPLANILISQIVP